MQSVQTCSCGQYSAKIILYDSDYVRAMHTSTKSPPTMLSPLQPLTISSPWTLVNPPTSGVPV